MVKKTTQKPIEHYIHTDKERVNNPPVGLVTPKSDPDKGEKKTYQYDPHLDPQLQWAGKAEHTSFDVPTVSLYVHERIDAKTIIESVTKTKDDGGQLSLFDEPKPLREALAFYQHKENWSNRLIAGDSLLVMNSLLEKEGMAGKVQTVYFDPPYGIKYGSNFQPFVNKRDVKDGKDEDLCAEPEMIKAFRDTWELGIHSYLTYLRDRLQLARELLADSGSIFVQISDENVHHVREIMDEVFGVENFASLICFQKTSSQSSKYLGSVSDFIIWYCRDNNKLKFRPIFNEKKSGEKGAKQYTSIISPDLREWRKLLLEEMLDTRKIPDGWKIFRFGPTTSQGHQENRSSEYKFEGEMFKPSHGRHWSYDPSSNAEMDVIIQSPTPKTHKFG